MDDRKVAGILVILLVLSLELNRHAVLRVSTQVEDFAGRLEGYLENALPDDLLAEECEYVAPDGFNLTLAERLWRGFSFHVSAGYTTEELRSEVEKLYAGSLVNATLSNGMTLALNLSGVAVERNLEDGSVTIRIPVASSLSLNYSRYNFTKKAGFYEAWNRTLVREYRVWRREPGWYTYTFEDLESNKSFTVVSKIWGEASRVEESWLEGLRKIGGGAWNQPVKYLPSFKYTKWGWMRTSGPIIAVPGHYEDVRIIVPQQEKSFKVLFPAYDPIIIEGWIVHVNPSTLSLNVGETLEASYVAEYCSPFGGEPEPLNATLTLYAPESLEHLNGVERKLDDTHASGVFRLKAVKPGTYNVTLRLDGNAVFANTGSREETYSVQVSSPPAPSLSVEIVEKDTSVLKHAKLVLRLRNNGGGVARNVVLEVTGRDVESVSRSLGSIEAGETKDIGLTIRLLQPASLARVRVAYTDEDANPYLVGFETMVSTETFWVPEHFKEYTVVVPEHEETLRVFVPGYEAATHIRFYALWDERILGEALFGAEKLRETVHYESMLSMGLTPVPVPGLGVELSFDAGKEALTRAGVNIMVKTIEPYYKYLGVLKEDELFRLTGVDKQSLRIGNISSDFKIEPLKPYWVKSGSVVLNATQLALYQAEMGELKKANPDIDYEYRETIVDVRTRVGSAEAGYVKLVYHPLKIVGEGPLKSIRVRNLAGIGLDYRVNVETFLLTLFRRIFDEDGWKLLCLNGEEDAVLLSSSLDSYRREVNVNLTCNGRLVAGARFILEPESSPFWKGFWDGLASQAWKIALTGVVMVVLTVASKGTVGALTLKLAVLTTLSATIVINALSQYNELGQIVFTSRTLREFGGIIASHANEFKMLGYVETASILNRAVEDVQKLVEAVGTDLVSILDFLSRVCVDVSLEEWMILLGLRDAEPYRKGFAWGKTVGNAISLLVFIAGFCHLATSGATPASLGAKAKAILQGAWNWLTPSLTDAIGAIRNIPKLAKGYSMLLTIFSNAKKAGKSIIDVLKMDTRAAMDLADISGRIWEKIMDAAKRKKLGDESIRKILEISSEATREGLEKFWKSTDTILSKSEGFAGEFFSWLKKAKVETKWVVEIVGELSKLDGGELDRLGKALAKVGDSLENGVKLFDIYFKTVKLEQYGKDVANAFAEAVSKNVEIIEIWKNAIDKGLKVLVDVGTSGDGIFSVKGRAPQGYQWIQAFSENSGKVVGEALRSISSGQEAIYLKGVKTGEKHILVFTSVDVENFLQCVKVRDTSGKYGITIGEWLEKKYNLLGFSFMKEGSETYLVIGGEKMARVEASLGEGANIVFLVFKVTDINGKTRIFHIGWKDGDPSFSTLLGEHPYPVNEFSQKAVRKEGSIVARLICVEYSKEMGQTSDLLTWRTEFDWDFLNVFTVDEELIDIRGSSARLEGALKQIFGDETVSELKSDRVRVALINKRGDEIGVRLASPTDLKVYDLHEGSKALGFLVLKMDEKLSTSIGDAVFRLGGNVIKEERTYLMDLTITKGSYDKTLRAKVTFWDQPSAWMKVKAGDMELIYKLRFDEKAQSATYESFLKTRESEVPLSEAKLGLLLDVKYLGDIAYIQGEGYDKIISLSEMPREGFEDFKGRPKHAWYVASYLKYEFEKTYVGWDIERVEYEYGENWFDVVAIKPNGRKAILEFKTVYDTRKSGELIEQAGRYIEACIRDPYFEEVHYVFQVDQNNEVPQEGMKGLYRALNEFLNTGKLKLPDGTVLLDMDPEEASKVLKVLTWAGGYLP